MKFLIVKKHKKMYIKKYKKEEEKKN